MRRELGQTLILVKLIRDVCRESKAAVLEKSLPESSMQSIELS